MQRAILKEEKKKNDEEPNGNLPSLSTVRKKWYRVDSIAESDIICQYMYGSIQMCFLCIVAVWSLLMGILSQEHWLDDVCHFSLLILLLR